MGRFERLLIRAGRGPGLVGLVAFNDHPASEGSSVVSLVVGAVSLVVGGVGVWKGVRMGRRLRILRWRGTND